VKVLNFSPEAILDSELKSVKGYKTPRNNLGFVYQWYQQSEIVPRISAKARELMSRNFYGKFSSLRTYHVGSGWYCTEVISSKSSGVIFYMSLTENNTSVVEAYVRNLRNSSPLSVLSSFAYNMTPQVSVVPGVDGTTQIYSILPTDRGILLDASNETTPDGIVVDWKSGLYSVPSKEPQETVIGRTALTLASFREE
jgi:hypothetical protein